MAPCLAGRTFAVMQAAGLDYKRVATAIRFLRAEAPRQPALAEVAAQVHLSPEHFQRLFTAWAGLSPKQFARTLTVGYAKALLQSASPRPPSLFEVADQVGLSSPSRLHDAFVRLEAMSPAEFRGGGAGASIAYAFAKTRFGESLIASTTRGICSLTFISSREAALANLSTRYPAASMVEATPDALQRKALDVIDRAAQHAHQPIALHVKGTPFQHQVWRALLAIPAGGACSYQQVAAAVDKPTGARAVGSAIGANRIAWLIPCHRVLRSDGDLSGYAWGPERKAAMLGVESLVK